MSFFKLFYIYSYKYSMVDFLSIYKEKFGDRTDTPVGRVLTEFVDQFNSKFSTKDIVSYITVTNSGDNMIHNVILEKINFNYKFITIKSKLDDVNVNIDSITAFQNDPISFSDVKSEEKLISILIDIMGHERAVILYNNISSINTYG